MHLIGGAILSDLVSTAVGADRGDRNEKIQVRDTPQPHPTPDRVTSISTDPRPGRGWLPHPVGSQRRYLTAGV